MVYRPPKLAVVIPCYNESEGIEHNYKVLLNKLDQLIRNKIVSKESFFAFVDDGSHDGTFEILEKIIRHNDIGIRLTKNYGHQYALLAGLEYIVNISDVSITIDSDLQQDINAFDNFLNEHAKGYDIVLGVRNSRATDSALKRMSAELYYTLVRLLGVKLERNHADYRLLSRKALKALLQFPERNIFFRALVQEVGFKRKIVHFDVIERTHGKTKYNFKKMVRIALDGSLSFSVFPLRLVSFFGLAVVGLSSLMVIYIYFSQYYSLRPQRPGGHQQYYQYI